MPLSFGALLRQYRSTAHMTQRALAEKAHLDFSYISKLENDRLPPPAADTIVLFCSILEIPANDLLASAGKLPRAIEEQIGTSVSAQTFLREAQDLTDKQWRHLSIHLPQIAPGLEKSILPIYANAYDLTQCANRFDAFGYLPELVHRLIRATVKDIVFFTMPFQEGTRDEGYDGILETERGNDFVPDYLSVWEMGVNVDPKQKADKDYRKRTDNPLHIQPSDTTFVFVTLRRWPGKANWVTEKRKEGKWRDVRVLDAEDLAAWLLLALSVHVWISRLMGKDPGNIRDLESFWLEWRDATNPPLSSSLLMAGRETVTKRLKEQLQAPASTLTIRADAQEEALACIAAVLDLSPESERGGLFARTLIVQSADAWSHIILTLQPLILIPMFSPVEAVQATRKGHLVLVPVGSEIAETNGVLVLPRLARRQTETELVEMGVKQEEASSLAVLAHRSLLSLRRRLAVNPALQQPTWAERGQARALLPALLAGSWNEDIEADRAAITTLTGRPYEDVEADLVGYAQIADPPMRKVGTIWFLTSQEDAWKLLARFLTKKEWDRFRLTTGIVLAALDPALKLPAEERWLAKMKEASRPHSRYLREGLAGTLAMMATRSVRDMAGNMRSEVLADGIIKQLLQQANDDQSGQMWLSIADILPILAEASPEAFVDALEKATKGYDPVARQFFTDQSSNWFSARSPHVDLLWALERLAWSPTYMSHAALFLARLVRLEPQGGRLANRPVNSLRGIFVPWYPQTAATFEARVQALDSLRKLEPEVSWKLMVALLPQLHETVDPSNTPRWQEWKSDKEDTTFNEVDVWPMTEFLETRLLEDAHKDMERICQIEERLENLPSSLREKVYQHLELLDPLAFELSDREALCAKLVYQIDKHQQFSQALWAMPSEDLERLKRIYERFKPEDVIQQVAPLFTGVPHLLDRPSGLDIQMQHEVVYQAQAVAAQRVYDAEGFQGILGLIEVVENPYVLGQVLGKSQIVVNEEVSLLQEFGSPNPQHCKVADTYAAERFLTQGWGWVDAQLAANGPLQTATHRALFFLALPRIAETWDRLEQWDDETINLYWTQMYPFVSNPLDCLRAAEKLLLYGRAWQTVELVAPYLDTVWLGTDFVLKMLEMALNLPLPVPTNQSFLYQIPQLIKYLEQLQKTEEDETRLARVELKVSPLLGYELYPFKTLYRQMATNPPFFAELVSLVYRASDEALSEVSAQRKRQAEVAYRLLHAANVIPGEQDADYFDEIIFTTLIEETRRILAEHKRETVGDLAIGQLLSHAKSGSDGIWPFEAIRELLEELRNEDIEQGMILGKYNARGVTWRGLFDGGIQERKLAEQYRIQAQAIQVRWSRTAGLLRKLAQTYDGEADLHDRETELRENGW